MESLVIMILMGGGEGEGRIKAVSFHRPHFLAGESYYLVSGGEKRVIGEGYSSTKGGRESIFLGRMYDT